MGVEIATTTHGDGVTFPKTGQTVTAHYVGALPQTRRDPSDVRVRSLLSRAVVVRAREVICVVEGGWGVPCQGVISIKMSKRERTRGGGIRERAGTGRAASRRDAGARRARECGARFPSSATTVRAAVH